MKKKILSIKSLCRFGVLLIALYGCFALHPLYAQGNASLEKQSLLAYQQSGTLEKTVSFICRNCSLKESLEKLSENAGVNIVYSLSDIKSIRLSEVEFVEKPLGEVLEAILRPHQLGYRLMNSRIVIKRIAPPATGSIHGKVYDADKPGEPLVGASVLIEELGKGGAVNINGEFLIEGVPEGTYTLLVSFVGYKTTRIEGVHVIKDNISNLEVALEEDAGQLNEVVVVGEVDVRHAPIVNSTEVSLISSIKASDVIVTGISNQQITRSLDRDAGDIVKRVPGVSMLNNFVLIRGMDPRYNVTMLNGMIMPSSELDTRAFSFNLLPSGVIDNIMAYKTASPELPGNFGGGVIKVQTKNAATARRIQLSLSGQFRTGGSSFADHTTYQEGSSKDWYGGGVAERQFPALLMDPDYNLPDFSYYPAEVAALGKQLPSVRNPKQEYHNIDKRARLNYYDSWKLGGTRLNNLTSLSYTQQRQFIEMYRQQEGGEYYKGEEGEWKLGNPLWEGRDSLFSEKVRLSAMENLSLKINKNHHLDFTSFFNRNVSDNTIIRNQEHFGNGLLVKTYSFRYNVRDMLQLQLSGGHTFGSHQLEWSAGLNKVWDDVPDQQVFEFSRSADGAEEQHRLWRHVLINRDGARMTIKAIEDAQIYQLNYTKTFKQGLKLKAGAYQEQRNKTFQAFRYLPDDKNLSGNRALWGPDPWNGLVDSIYTHLFYEDGTGLGLKSVADPGIYSFDDEIRAGYASFNLPLFREKLMLHGGLRYEWNERYLYNEKGISVDSVVVDIDDGKWIYEKTPDRIQRFLLPSLNVSYKFSEKTMLRGAYGKTIDRPQYGEQSTIRYFNFEGAHFTKGNPLLINAEIHNFDLRFEHYPSPSEFLAIGGFYKRLINAIERKDVSDANWDFPEIHFVNTPQAVVYGVEAELRKNLHFIAPALSNFSVILNGALLKSIVEHTTVVGGGTKLDNRSLQGTSPYLLNASLYYDNERSGTQLSALYNIAGPRMWLAPNGYLGGIYESERHALDFSINQRISKFLSLKAGVQNLLNSPYRFFRDGNVNGTYEEGPENLRMQGGTGKGDFIQSEYKAGAYYSLGLNFTF